MKTFEYRLYPTKAQRVLLMECLSESRLLYNSMLTAVKDRYTANGTFIFRYELSSMFKGSASISPATVVQTIADRLDKALRRFIQARKDGLRAGFPRFKTIRQWRSIHLRQYAQGHDFSFNGRYLVVPHKLGRNIKIKLHRPLEGTPKTCHLVLRGDFNWYALIVCDMPPVTIDLSRPDIGIDLGLKSFIVDSDGNITTPPRFFHRASARIRVLHRTLDRRKRGSKRKRKAVHNLAKCYLKVARQRKDFICKTVKPYADSYSRIFVEKLNVSGLLKNHHLARSISDAGWALFVSTLERKAESAGGRVIKVPPRNTSQNCSHCGVLVVKSLSVRTHVCPYCGFVANRDHNAALNILRLGRSLQAQTWTDVGSSVA